MNTYIVTYVTLIAIAFCSAGCLNFPQKDFPQKKSYIIELRRDLSPLSTDNNFTLGVRTIKISSPYNLKEFVYRKSLTEYRSDFYNEFISEPSVMLTDQLRRWLSESGLFQNVVRPNSEATPTHLLECYVNEMYGDYRDREAFTARLEIQLIFIDDTGADPRIVFDKLYQKSVVLAKATPQDLVSGWTQGLQQILNEVESDAGKLLVNKK